MAEDREKIIRAICAELETATLSALRFVYAFLLKSR